MPSCISAGQARAARAGGDRLVTQVYALKLHVGEPADAGAAPDHQPEQHDRGVRRQQFPGDHRLRATTCAASSASSKPSTGPAAASRSSFRCATPPRADVAQTLNRVLPTASSGPARRRAAVDPVDARLHRARCAHQQHRRALREPGAHRRWCRSMVEQLDVRTGTAGNMHVVYLKNAEAAAGGADAARHPFRRVGPCPAPRAAPRARGRIARPRPRQAARWRQGGGMVQADPASNALLISAPDAMFAHIKAIIEKLDVRRAQVYVEALIVELTGGQGGRVRHPVAVARRPQRRTQTRVIGGTNFSGGRRPTSSMRLDQPRHPGHRPQHRRGEGADHDSRDRHRDEPRRARPRAGDGRQCEHPGHAQPAHARQRGSEDRHRPERARSSPGSTRRPEARPPRRRSRPSSARTSA